MHMINDEKIKKSACANIILVVGSAFVLALLIVGFVYYCGSSRSYLLSHVLISPDSLERVAWNAETSNRLEFVKSETIDRECDRHEVSLEKYRKFYDLVRDRKSDPQLGDVTFRQFEVASPTILTIFAQSKESENRIFQRIQFLEGDFFRIELPQALIKNEKSQEWTYFYYLGIYDKAIVLFEES